jgi:hypothetical protein
MGPQSRSIALILPQRCLEIKSVIMQPVFAILLSLSVHGDRATEFSWKIERKSHQYQKIDSEESFL